MQGYNYYRFSCPPLFTAMLFKLNYTRHGGGTAPGNLGHTPSTVRPTATIFQ
jgi:hypothetical protein